MKDPFNPKIELDPKDKQKTEIGRAIEIKMGRPPVNMKERRKRAALTDMLAGDKIADIERKYAVAHSELIRYMKTVFPTDEDRFEFLENCLLTNASLAGAKFVDKYGELTAVEAAKAMAVFSNSALAVKKARESGFKEAPINVGIMLQLQETLNRLTEVPKEDND